MTRPTHNGVGTFRVMVEVLAGIIMVGMAYGLSAMGSSDGQQWATIRDNCSVIDKTTARLDGHIEQFVDFRAEQRKANSEILAAIRKHE